MAGEKASQWKNISPRMIILITFSFFLILAGAWLYNAGFNIKTPANGSLFDVAQNLIIILVILAIFLERALEVYVTTLRQPGRRDMEIAINEFENEIEFMEGQTTPDQNKIRTKKKELSSTRNELEKYRSQTHRIINVVMILAAIVLSAVGPRILSAFYEIPQVDPTTDAWQKLSIQITNAYDIFITAGLIAGGAKGINKISAVLASYSEALKKNVKG